MSKPGSILVSAEAAKPGDRHHCGAGDFEVGLADRPNSRTNELVALLVDTRPLVVDTVSDSSAGR